MQAEHRMHFPYPAGQTQGMFFFLILTSKYLILELYFSTFQMYRCVTKVMGMPHNSFKSVLVDAV